jgi:hypothetical protein
LPRCDELDQCRFAERLENEPAVLPIEQGFLTRQFQLARNANGLLAPVSEQPDASAGRIGIRHMPKHLLTRSPKASPESHEFNELLNIA